MTLPGVPLVYYGDEAGLVGGKDPENRKAYPWDRENKDILDFYKLILGIRNKENSLKKGNFKFYNTDLDVCVFERCYENEKIIVAVNIKDSRTILENVNLEGSYIDMLDKDKEYKGLGINNILALDGYDIKVLKGKK
jgi:glycosidase